jgi:hypothetical protein
MRARSSGAKWALFEVLQSWSNAALYVGGQRTASPEILSLTGVSVLTIRHIQHDAGRRARAAFGRVIDGALKVQDPQGSHRAMNG